MKPLKTKAEPDLDHWEQIIQAVKVEEPASAYHIIKIVQRADKDASFHSIDSEICKMARLKVIRRQWQEGEEWAKAKEVFIYEG